MACSMRASSAPGPGGASVRSSPDAMLAAGLLGVWGRLLVSGVSERRALDASGTLSRRTSGVGVIGLPLAAQLILAVARQNCPSGRFPWVRNADGTAHPRRAAWVLVTTKVPPPWSSPRASPSRSEDGQAEPRTRDPQLARPLTTATATAEFTTITGCSRGCALRGSVPEALVRPPAPAREQRVGLTPKDAREAPGAKKRGTKEAAPSRPGRWRHRNGVRRPPGGAVKRPEAPDRRPRRHGGLPRDAERRRARRRRLREATRGALAYYNRGRPPAAPGAPRVVDAPGVRQGRRRGRRGQTVAAVPGQL